MAGVIGTNIITHVGFVVKDIYKTKAMFAKFLGLKEPVVFNAGSFEVTQTEYKNKMAPKANCLITFFDVNDNFQLELIEPNGQPSVWQEFLDVKGEGMHHIAFCVKGMAGKIKACREFGMELVQKGEYGDANGRYAYLSACDGLKTMIELLENYNNS